MGKKEADLKMNREEGKETRKRETAKERKRLDGLLKMLENRRQPPERGSDAMSFNQCYFCRKKALL